MRRVYVPSAGPDSWKQFLAQPELHWATGYSARTLAHCWEAAAGLPPEIERLLVPSLGETELLLALPEHKVPLPGGQRESQSDIFLLLGTTAGLVACTIEGKVDESFDQTIAEWSLKASAGKQLRLSFLCATLGIAEPPPGSIRYQLLHRTASALIEAERFHAPAAAMIVHSFSPTRRWFEDFADFVRLLGGDAAPDRLIEVPTPAGKPLYLGWASGDLAFRSF
jgi:hypothetical protein